MTFRAQIPSSGPVFSTGAMGRIPITLKVSVTSMLEMLFLLFVQSLLQFRAKEGK